jgi:hypothetical protein
MNGHLVAGRIVPMMRSVLWRTFWVLMLIVGVVVLSMLLWTPLERPKLGIERADCFYLMGDGVVTATPIPGCPTRPPGRPGPSLTPLTPEERERLLRRYPHG